MKKGEPSVWTEGPGNRLRELWDEGLTAIQCARMISKEFGFAATRNAVISRVHRWHLPPRNITEAQKRERVYTPRDQPISPPEPVVQPEPFIQANPVSQVNALPRHCRFPMWADEDHPREFFFCGEPTVDGLSWCAACRKRVFSPSGPRKELAA